MKRNSLAIFCVLLLLTLWIAACKELDDGPLISYRNDTIQVPDTVTPPDPRLPFTGIFHVDCHYIEAFWGEEWYHSDDSVTLYETTTVSVPLGNGHYGYPVIDSLGTFSTNFNSNPYIQYDGGFVGLDSFHLYMHMDQVPHTYSYDVSGHRL